MRLGPADPGAVRRGHGDRLTDALPVCCHECVPRGKRILLVVASLAVVAALVRGYVWWTHPTLLSHAQVGGSGSAAPRPVSKAALLVGVAGSPWRAFSNRPAKHLERITLHGATSHFRINTAAATTEFFLCRAKDNRSIVGTMDGEPSDFCSKVRPLRDGTSFLFGSADYVTVRVAPARAGIYDLDYVTLDYSRGGFLGQHGKDKVHIATSGKVTAG